VTRLILPSSHPEVARRAGSSLVDPSPEERSLLIDPVELVVSLGALCKLEFDRDPARTLQQVVDAAKRLLDADGVGLMLADTNRQLRQASASNQQVQTIEEHQDRAALGLCAAALAKRTPICIRDLHQDPDSYGMRMVLNEAQIVAALSVPVELDGHPIGTLSVYSATPRDWGAKEVSAVQAYAGIVASLLAAAARRAREGAAGGAVADGAGPPDADRAGQRHLDGQGRHRCGHRVPAHAHWRSVVSAADGRRGPRPDCRPSSAPTTAATPARACPPRPRCPGTGIPRMSQLPSRVSWVVKGAVASAVSRPRPARLVS
jgi:putative methionine-R-sulfoxide reductase with GAF domain